MKPHHYTAFALALLLFVLQPVPAKQVNAQGQMIELNIHASVSNFAVLPFKVRVRDGEVSTMTMHKPGQTHYQYMIRTQRLALSGLSQETSKIPSPLAISIRIDTSDDGKTWLLHTHTNFIATLGTTVAAEVSDLEKSTNLVVSSRLVSDAEHQTRKM